MTGNAQLTVMNGRAVVPESAPSSQGEKALHGAQRLEVLDALRGVAAVAVVLYHYTVHYTNHFAPNDHARIVFSRGNLGVDLFFCISGFVISMTLERCRDWRDFGVRRFARIYPAYAASIVFTYVVFSRSDLPKFHYGPADLLMNFTMLQQLLGFSHIDGVYWTLQVELLFYVIVASLHFGGLLKNPRLICLLWLLLSSAYAWVRQVHPTLPTHLAGDVLILERAPLFIIGMLAFDFHKHDRVDRDGVVLVALCIAYQLTTSLLFAGLAATAGFVLLLIASKVRLQRMWSIAMFLGSISFSLYLVHQHFGYMVIREAIKIGATLDQGICVAIAASIGVASFITFAIEKPAQRFIVRSWQTATARRFARTGPTDRST